MEMLEDHLTKSEKDNNININNINNINSNTDNFHQDNHKYNNFMEINENEK